MRSVFAVLPSLLISSSLQSLSPEILCISFHVPPFPFSSPTFPHSDDDDSSSVLKSARSTRTPPLDWLTMMELWQLPAISSSSSDYSTPDHARNPQMPRKTNKSTEGRRNVNSREINTHRKMAIIAGPSFSLSRFQLYCISLIYFNILIFPQYASENKQGQPPSDGCPPNSHNVGTLSCPMSSAAAGQPRLPGPAQAFPLPSAHPAPERRRAADRHCAGGRAAGGRVATASHFARHW
jgi:hypothetical protein